MQASMEKNLNPDHDLCSQTEISDQDFHTILKIEDENNLIREENNEENDEEEEFSFMCGGEFNGSPISAEDIFINGQIKPVFPLFNGQDHSGEDYYSSSRHHENLPMRPPVKKIFVETTQEERKKFHLTSSAPEDDVIAGPCCDLTTRKVVESSPEVCKKSNSTGFSKIWRLKDLVGRSNSDGRDAFVFLNSRQSPAPEKAAVVVEEKREAAKAVKRSGGKGNTAALSAHEVYLKSKAKEEERRRSTYLPYRPELMGFFTNVNGGLTKNVHPY